MLGFSLRQKESATKNQLLGKGKKKCTHIVSVPAVGVVHVFCFCPGCRFVWHSRINQFCHFLWVSYMVATTISNNKIINTADKHFNYIQLWLWDKDNLSRKVQSLTTLSVTPSNFIKVQSISIENRWHRNQATFEEIQSNRNLARVNLSWKISLQYQMCKETLIGELIFTC